MKIPQPFTIYDLPAFAALRRGRQFAFGRKSGRTVGYNRQSSIINRQSQRGIALVITLIMLAITLVMAVAFLALAQRERKSVDTTTDTTTARLAAETGAANATAQIVANMLNGFNGLGSSNAYNLRLLVSTNYINPAGFNSALGYVNPTNVSYTYPNGNRLSAQDLPWNVASLWYLPRVPVYVSTNPSNPGFDFRYYLDLNENGRFERYGYIPQIGPNGGFMHPDGTENNNPANVVTNFATGGDPEWIGVLEHPDAPHGPNNHFISRYAFIAVPVGNALDINYVHNQANNGTLPISANDYFMRNQGVGSWEINLAAFLADLNTNEWGQSVGSGATAPLGSASYYQYNEPDGVNSGFAFADARALLAYRYNGNRLANANSVFLRALPVFRNDGIDDFSDGPLQTTLDTNADFIPKSPLVPWSGADNPNHFFTLGDYFDLSKTTIGVPPPLPPVGNDFTGRLKAAGSSNDTYNAYTFYRMLDQLGSDSTAEDGKLNLNYSNAVVQYTNVNGVFVPTGVNVVIGAETNLVPWTPQNFFIAAADQMLRAYSANWFQSSPSNYLLTYYGAFPRGKLDATGLGVTNFPNYGVTNQIPSFGITNIPVFINGTFVYSPAVNRLLQLAANLYDATTNNNFNFPHIFRPIFEHDTVGNVFIVGYTNLYSVNGPNTVSGSADPQLAAPFTVTQITNYLSAYTPILGPSGLVNVYGVPWIIGAKNGLPNFNQFYMVNAAQVTRKIEITRSSTDANTATYATNQMYVIGIGNNLGVSWWNSYDNAYPRPLKVYASDVIAMTLTNGVNTWSYTTNFTTGGLTPGNPVVVNPWKGSQWSGTAPNTTPNAASFINANWSFTFLSPQSYNFNTGGFDSTGQWQIPAPPLFNLPQFDLLITNYLQAYILDGNHVIDYVQLRDPITIGGLNQALADPNYVQANNIYYQWSTNIYPSAPPTPYGVVNQTWVSGHPASAPTAGGAWSTAATPMGETTPPAEAAYFNGFFVPSFQYNGQTYINNLSSIQAPYTPTRTVFSAFLLQANDPLVHYLSSDLNAQIGAQAVWSAKQSWQNCIWNKVDDLVSQPLPTPPENPIGGRYQPWLRKGQMDTLSALAVVPVTNNYGCKDSLVEGSDNWDFPTNAYPAVGWIGRVHRGTPWQTVYLKDYDLTKAYNTAGGNILYVGTNTWANWTGDILQNFGQYYDAANYAPIQDRLLFDIFTTRFNDNAVRGTLPVNQTGLAAWSALFSGMVAISNSTPLIFQGIVPTYTNFIINPAGVVNSAQANPSLQPLLWQLVDYPGGINTTRANTNLFPYHAFIHAGDILATPALTTNMLNLGTPKLGYQQINYGINDEEYEWLPQHMMGLVRATEPRYILYCFGQALRPAPNGTMLSGPFPLLVTNYQVVAESAVRMVIHVDNANTATPHAVVEHSNVLPPN